MSSDHGRAPIERLLQVMRDLRDPESGCPWDLEQSFESIAPYTIEEAYEVADAIDRKAWEDLRRELGDLLLQVVYHTQIAAEASLFDFDAVAEAITQKMIDRHPHVFGNTSIASAEAQSEAWEAQKDRERAIKSRGDTSVLEDIPIALPALVRAQKLQKRAARVGFDWDDHAEVLAKIREELSELEAALQTPGRHTAVEEELGDLLFSVVNLARHLKCDAEPTLRNANQKFERRFRQLETVARERNLALAKTPIEILDDIWTDVKRRESDA